MRERMDICLFHDELDRLENVLGDKQPVSDNQCLHPTFLNNSFESHSPFSPQTPKSWSDIGGDGEPIVKLSLLRSTWSSIQALEGGELEFGYAAIEKIFEIGGQRMRNFFRGVDMQRLSVMMPKLLRQVLGHGRAR